MTDLNNFIFINNAYCKLITSTFKLIKVFKLYFK